MIFDFNAYVVSLPENSLEQNGSFLNELIDF